jgi:predicted DNA-binding transcriptional regulator AlpA
MSLSDAQSSGANTLIPKPYLARELGVSSRTLSRWLKDAGVEFPRPVTIRGRLYFDRPSVEVWKAARVRASLKGEATAK